MSTTWYRKLEALGACREAVEWAKGKESFAVAWQECERGDWMLWLLAEKKVDRKKLVVVACDCAELALPYTKDRRVKRCIETTRAWVRGEVGIEEVKKAGNAAYAAADAAAYAAADAAYAAANAAYFAYAAADDAANAADDAADAADDAADAAYVDRKTTYSRYANIVRTCFPEITL